MTNSTDHFNAINNHKVNILTLYPIRIIHVFPVRYLCYIFYGLYIMSKYLNNIHPTYLPRIAKIELTLLLDR